MISVTWPDTRDLSGLCQIKNFQFSQNYIFIFQKTSGRMQIISIIYFRFLFRSIFLIFENRKSFSYRNLPRGDLIHLRDVLIRSYLSWAASRFWQWPSRFLDFPFFINLDILRCTESDLILHEWNWDVLRWPIPIRSWCAWVNGAQTD